MNDFVTSSKQLRWFVYTLLITASTGVMIARVMSVSAKSGQVPFLSANDRSRWSTMRALVDHGTYAIDEVIYRHENGKPVRDRNGQLVVDWNWQTIDMVRHVDRYGKLHSYSSKPTLLTTMLAGQYWVVKQLTRTTVAERPFYIGRVVLLLTNVLPLIGYFFLMAWLVERTGMTDWGRLFVMTCVTFGTFVTTFAVSINNHLPATIAAALAVFAFVRIWNEGARGWHWFALAGLSAAFTAANELPALSFCCLLGAILLLKSPLMTLLGYVPAVAVVAAAFFGTNYLAHDSWRPPYAHRSDGAVVGKLEAEAADLLDRQEIPSHLRDLLTSYPTNVDISPDAFIEAEEPGQRWVFSDQDEAVRFAIVRDGDQLNVHEWDRWYRFAGAYWRSGKENKIDAGEPSAGFYAMNVLVGHHGIFSLTPIWILAVIGLGMLLVEGRREERMLAAMVAIVSVVVIGFYLSRPQLDRTYGGFTSGFRWAFWFAPLWLMMLVPAADWLARNRVWRTVALLLLLLSVFSAFYPGTNPWTHPWIYDYWVYLEWIEPPT